MIVVNLILILLLINSATTYINYIVGGYVVWFFNATTNTSTTNYSSWVANQTFSLNDDGDINVSSSLVVIEKSMEPQSIPNRT